MDNVPDDAQDKFRPARLARALTELRPDKPISSQAISQWQRVPSERVIDVEKITGVPRELLRPDIYPPEPKSESAA